MNNIIPKVAYYTRYIPHYRHGVFELLSKRNDMEVTFASADQSTDATIYSPTQRNFPFRSIRYWYFGLPNKVNKISFSRHVLSVLIRKEYDVLILSNDILGIDVWIVALFKRLFGIRLVVWGQGISRPETAMRIFLRKMLMHLSDACVFYGEDARDIWITRGLSPEKSYVAYNALDTDTQFFHRQNLTAADLDGFREQNGCSGKKMIIFSGRLVPEKRADHVVRAMRKVIQKVPNAHLVVVGDGPERENIEKIIEENDLRGCCSLVGAVYDEQILAKYFLISRAAVMPAYAGLAIQHAFAYAVPVILSNIKDSHGPEAKLVVDGETGFVFAESDPDGLPNSIIKVLENDELQKKLSNNASQVIVRKYNKQKMADGIVQAVRWAMK